MNLGPLSSLRASDLLGRLSRALRREGARRASVVTLTPLAVSADSRTLRQVAAVARWGFESVLIEGASSPLDLSSLNVEHRTLPREAMPRLARLLRLARSLRPRPARAPEESSSRPGTDASAREPAAPARPRSATRAALGRFLTEVKVASAFFVEHVRTEALLPLLHLPPASVYYVHSPHLVWGLLARAWWHRARIVYDVHDLYPYNESDGTRPAERHFIYPLLRLAERALSRSAAEVITVNESQRRLHVEHFGRDSTVVRNCEDPRLHRSCSRDLRRECGIGSEVVLFVSTGAAKDGQAFGQALAALRQLPAGIHLAFVGRGHEANARHVEAAGLAGRVHLLPAVPSSEVVPFVRAADAAVLLYYDLSPNYRACLPNKFFQSVEAHLPLVYPPLPEIAALGDALDLGVKVDPCDAADVARGMAALADPARRARHRAACERAAPELSYVREEAVLRRAIERAMGL